MTPGPRPRRSAAFAHSDIHNAAEDFIVAISEHAETVWEDYDVDELIETLTDAAFAVLRNRTAIFSYVE